MKRDGVDAINPRSHWRRAARAAIQAALEASVGKEPGERIRAISDAYPFGERKFHPYRIWLSEVSRVKMELMGKGKDKCRACGAKTGQPCTPMNGELAAGGRHFVRDNP